MRSHALSALSGLLLAASFPLFGMDFMAWWALVPLFFAMQGRTPAQCALYGLTLGAVFYMVGMSWVTNTLINYGHIPGWLSWMILGLLAAYLSLYTGLFGYLLQRISRGNAVIFFLLAAPCGRHSNLFARCTRCSGSPGWVSAIRNQKNLR